jgi:hypothetical protein
MFVFFRPSTHKLSVKMPTVTDGDHSLAAGDASGDDSPMNADDSNVDDSNVDNSVDATSADESGLNNSNNGRGSVSGAPPPTQINKLKYANPVNMIKRERRQSSSRYWIPSFV